MKGNKENYSAIAEDLSNKVADTFALAAEMGWSCEDVNTVAAEMVAGIFYSNAPTRKYHDKAIELFDEAVRNCYESYIKYCTQQNWDLMQQSSLLFSKRKQVFDEKKLHMSVCTLYKLLYDDKPATMYDFVRDTSLIIAQIVACMHRDDKEAASETISKVIEEIRVKFSKYLKQEARHENKE